MFIITDPEITIVQLRKTIPMQVRISDHSILYLTIYSILLMSFKKLAHQSMQVCLPLRSLSAFYVTTYALFITTLRLKLTRMLTEHAKNVALERS